MSETERPNQQPIPALQALEKHLLEQQDHGVERLHLTPEAQSALNSMGAAVKAAAPKPAEAPAPQPQPAAAPPPEPVDAPPLTEAEKRLKLRDIAIRAKKCERAKSLGSLRQHFVFATGNPDADLMFVGEAPGMEEEKKHRPFVGPAGQLLDKIVKVMGFERDDIYISNIVKFRPSTGDADQGSRNRKPTVEEMSASVSYVKEEVEVVRPKVIVALGGTAMQGLLGLEGSLGSHRSKFHDLNGVPVMITYHPSYLLRSGEKSEKRKVWEDLLLVMEKLQMPISAKQRSFFL